MKEIYYVKLDKNKSVIEVGVTKNHSQEHFDRLTKANNDDAGFQMYKQVKGMVASVVKYKVNKASFYRECAKDILYEIREMSSNLSSFEGVIEGFSEQVDDK
ncbi:MAG: hypothetical protein ACTSW1_08420 [Candidatus Hodarchaeales archaeon]